MTGRNQRGGAELPVGRRIARLRARRGMTQQIFASRVGRSKSWVDKVERGLRTLDRLSVIETVAGVLGVTPEVLLGKGTRRGEPAAAVPEAIARMRAALASYHVAEPGDPDWRPPPPLGEIERQVAYAWTAYRHADHHQVLRMLPDLLGDARRAGEAGGAPGAAGAAELLVGAYRLAAQLLVKLGEPSLAWLAADRAMAAAAGDPRRAALAAVPLAQALRALGQSRLAMTAATVAARRLSPPPTVDHPPRHRALAGTLLVEAALAAATYRDHAAARDLLAHATRLAEAPATGPAEPQAARPAEAHDTDDIGYGPLVVELARALVTAELGDAPQAITIHTRATGQDDWQRLPAEQRAAHLIGMARVHLDAADPRAAGRALLTADRIAPAETRLRPAARTVLTAVFRDGPAAADVARLAATLGLTRG
ncbi:helix-turn-helix domain-containing protein [Micromonospora sp. RTGN7]|uniref:helix-turn-helix domain-containing protein n=1 Tax=Micromonospora sp. RTGN7 TaxID=3016526 RepID=UPI0029FF4282|nr:helix-turn-helix domain-containing protein [Micromonospora sp. RTGN7]